MSKKITMITDRLDYIFKDIVETIRQPLLILNSDLRVVLASRSFYHLYKVKPEDTVGQLIYDLGNKQWDISKLRKLLESILPENTTFDNYKVEHNFDTIGKRTMLLNARHIKRGLAKEQFILLAIEDITERVRLEDLLKESEKRYRRLFETANDGILLLEKDEFKIRHANPAITSMLSFSNEDCIGNTMEDIGLIFDKETPKEVLQNLAKNDVVFFNDVPVVTKDRRNIYTDIYMVDKTDLVQCNIRDITKSKQTKSDLQISESKHRLMMESITDPIYICSQELIVEYLSPAMIDRLGRDATGETCYRAIHGLDHVCDWCVFNTITKGKTIENSMVSPLDDRSYRVTNIPVQHPNKNISKMSIFKDVTEYQTVVAERNKAQIRLQQFQKMESIGNLAGGIAHDFNNILFSIIGYSELLMGDLPPDSKKYIKARNIFNAGMRAKELVKQILVFSRQSEHEMIPVQIQNVVVEALKLCRSSIPTDIEINQNIQIDCKPVNADPTQVHQVAMNLITNAYHAMKGKNGIISVEFKEVTLEDYDVTSSLLIPGRYVLLSVSDNGCGISPSNMNKIYDPYFTTKEKDKGTGLGLAVVYGIVKEHKGDIKVYSEVGKGTNFNVYFPLMEKFSETVLKNHASKLPTGTEKILLVDDECIIVQLEKQMLEHLGYKVTASLTSIEAHEIFKTNPDAFDLVLTDITMPGMTGDQLAKKLISIRSDIPIIVCTGFSTRINKEKTKLLGIKGFLMKPIVISEMAQMVRKVLDERKNHDK